jgi:hypothetical protein
MEKTDMCIDRAAGCWTIEMVLCTNIYMHQHQKHATSGTLASNVRLPGTQWRLNKPVIWS